MREGLKHRVGTGKIGLGGRGVNCLSSIFPSVQVRKIIPLGQLASIYCRHTGGRVARGPLPPRAVGKMKGGPFEVL